MDTRCPECGENCPGNSATKWLWTLASSLARVPPWTNKQIPHLAQNVVVPKISNTRGRFQRSASRMGKWCRLLCRRIRSRTRHSGRKTLKQHLAMHAATLTTYEQVCAVVVSYLPAKTVWIPTATYAAGHTARARDPDAMNVDKSMTRKAKEKENRRKARKEKAKEKATAKRAKKANTAKTQGKTKKGKSAQSAGETIPHKNAGTTRRAKGNKARMARLVKVGGNIQSISDKNMSTAPTSVGPSVSHAGIPAGNGASAKSGIRHVYDRERVMRIGKKQWQSRSQAIMPGRYAARGIQSSGSWA